MKKFSKVLLIFALVSVVLLGVLVSCKDDPVDEYDFAAWQADLLDYELAGLAKVGLKDELGDGKELKDIKGVVDYKSGALYTALFNIFKEDGGTLSGALGDVTLIAVEGKKVTAEKFDAELLVEVLEGLLMAANEDFVDDTDPENLAFDDDVVIDEPLAVSVTVTVGLYDATKDIVLKYLVVDTTED